LESTPSPLPEPVLPALPNFGREIKIGVAVILVLLIVFGGMLYRRLTHGPARPIAEQRKEERLASHLPPLGRFDGDSTQPTVVTATAGSSHSGRRISVAEMAPSSWSGGGEGLAADKADPARPPKPSFMPPLPPSDTGGSPWQKHKHDGDGSRVAFASANEGDGGNPAAKKCEANPNPFVGVPPLPPATFVANGKAAPVQPVDRPPLGSPDANPLRDPPPGASIAAAGGLPPPPSSAAGYSDISSRSSVPLAGAPPAAMPAGSGLPGAGDPGTLPPAYDPGVGRPAGAISGRAFSPPYAGSGAPHTYTVQPNDNYWKISEKVYGTGAYFQALAEQNRKKIPDESRLRPGDTISIPPVGELEKKYAALCPKPNHRDTTQRQLATANTVSTVSQVGGGRVYVVQEGDNLYDIARWELGKVTRWPEIYDLNREALGNDPDHLTPGMRLVLPGDRAPDRPGGMNKVAERPDDTIYRR
jgi:nucleoid-associated protein YgaU